MKKLLLILPFLILLSCSVQKRKYQKGFYVSNLKHKRHIQIHTGPVSKEEANNEVIVLKTIPLQKEFSENELLLVSAGNDINLSKSSASIRKLINPDSLCDKIILRNGDEFLVKVLEITPNDVKYKKCDSPDGPLYVAKKADVFMITYANGTKELFKSESTQASSQNQNAQKDIYKRPKKTHPMAILALIFGLLGIWPLTGLASILAIIFGNQAIKKIRQYPDQYKGETMARVGKIMGVVVLSIIGFALLLAILIAL